MDYSRSGSWPVLIQPWKLRAREKHGSGDELRRLGRVLRAREKHGPGDERRRQGRVPKKLTRS